ncbi:MAG TPA: histidine phosphatase family protein [Actinomycetota bacterium]|nr:histidine phosphatase family protein [Actinomycetota bacterium]
MTITRILLVRHGATEWNTHKRAQGHADIALTDEGISQALHAAGELSETDIAAVYSSDLKRAYDTAMVIAKDHGVEVTVDRDFREIDQGEWEGLTVDEIRAGWPDLWGPARHFNARPGGETPHQVRKRSLEALERAVKAHPDSTIVVVSHGGTIRWLSAEALGYDDRRSARIRGLGNGGIVCVSGRLEDGVLMLGDHQRWDGATPDLDDPND